jgi:tRNA pseudouridine38-40 synthase
MEQSAHARFDATARTYDYFIHTYKDPFLSEMSSLYLMKDLNLNEMKRAIALLTEYTNFHAFCRSPEKHNSTVCKVTSAKLYTDVNGDKFRFQITANRFLKGMIRIIVGKLLEIGKGEFTVDEFEHALKTQEEMRLIIPAHPQGLYLSKVTYPSLDLPPRAEFTSILGNKVDDAWKEIA